MLNTSSLFLVIILLLGIIGKNQSITIAAYVLLGVKVLQLDDKLFPFLASKGMSIGITVLTIAVLVPIASGEIGFKDLYASVKSYYAWVALAAGILVAILGKYGVNLMASDPQVTVALVIGTILAVVLLNGVAVGPLIGAGITYMVLQVIGLFTK
ncbi:Uncharacterized membrane protein, DUF441 family [Terribacillus aidingensis]|uniref:UPF0756 membrane protein SAMN05421503_2154 n=1 Tax=Terribacillus aidingensis TaxID=586416 RepID=A0A285NS93_9BACI|nr:DUF441 domain-containing protein [Terribacillus aidingensis]SNZ11837.1 Uncharacterized membrane protein, DUF441 family [Terribacillus aidingensis]